MKTFDAKTWIARPASGGLAAGPLALMAVPMALAGAADAAARLQRRALSVPGDGRTGAGRVLAHSAVAAVPGLVAFALTALLLFLCYSGWLYPLRPDTFGALGHPFTPDPDLDGAWGGPTLAGAWAVHALVALAMQIPCLLLLRAVRRLQTRLARTLLPVS